MLDNILFLEETHYFTDFFERAVRVAVDSNTARLSRGEGGESWAAALPNTGNIHLPPFIFTGIFLSS